MFFHWGRAKSSSAKSEPSQPEPEKGALDGITQRSESRRKRTRLHNEASMKILTLPQIGQVEVRRSPKAKNLSLRVLASGSVRMSLPMRYSEKRAFDFLVQKTEWVLRAQRRMSSRERLLDDGLTSEERSVKIEALRKIAKEDLPPRVERISRLTGLRYSRLTIRQSKTRWGSCSSLNSISLSLFLVALPEHLRDFVILHELCHTRYHNHSSQFHALVNHFSNGKEAVLEKELRGYTIGG